MGPNMGDANGSEECEGTNKTSQFILKQPKLRNREF